MPGSIPELDSVVVVSCLNQRGRLGKTTLAIHLSAVLAERGSVLGVDAGSPEFAPHWRAQPQLSAEYPVVGSPWSAPVRARALSTTSHETSDKLYLVVYNKA